MHFLSRGLDMAYASLRSTGSCLPKGTVTNQDLEKTLNTSDEWIVSRSGIQVRHVVSDDERLIDLAYAASKEALARSGLAPEAIDLVLVCTSTPDTAMPSTACSLQGMLGIKPGPAFDLNAACSGFLYGLKTAHQWIELNQAKHVLLVGADVMSRIVDWSDRSTCILFGDGAGAVVLSASDKPGLYGVDVSSDGSFSDKLYTTGRGFNSQDPCYLKMQGREVYKQAVKVMERIVYETLDRHDFKANDLDFLVPHQANIRIIQSLAQHLNLPMDRVVVTIEKMANTTAASVPLALDFGIVSGQLKPGSLILVEAFGAGFTWGSALWRL
jgi:3-oxoacyl-[acyl-carrier-protein] synthase III